MIVPDMIVEMCEAITRLQIPASASYTQSLRNIVATINDTSGLFEYEKTFFEQALLSLLCKRVRVEHYVQRNEALRHSAVTRPIFIVGLPRTGTTLLSKLLSKDPARRSLLNWEVESPIPAPTSLTLTTDPRCATRKQIQEIILKHKPDRGMIHWEFADEPTECTQVLAQDFRVGLFDVAVRIPAYLQQLESLDSTPSYEYHKRFLQLLQSRAPGAWNLKSPIHAYNLQPLLKVYPDARLICTHRDPYRAFGSLCSLWRDHAKRFTHYNPMHNPTEVIAYFLMSISRLMTDTKQLSGKSIYHLQYQDLVRDPLAEMRKLHEWMGESFSEQSAATVTAYLRTHPQHRYGKHAYSLDDFGISVARLRSVAEDYISAFHIAREP